MPIAQYMAPPPCGAALVCTHTYRGPLLTVRVLLQGLPIASADGKKLLENTTFFLTVTPRGGLNVEAQSPGTLAEQQPLLVGTFRSRRLTAAVMKSFVGLNALDPIGSLDIGGCFLYFANGFKLKDQPRNRHQFLEGDALRGVQPELLEASVSLFKLPFLGKKLSSPLLLNGVQDLSRRRVAAAAKRRERRAAMQ